MMQKIYYFFNILNKYSTVRTFVTPPFPTENPGKSRGSQVFTQTGSFELKIAKISSKRPI